jgi:hypothetical protein
MVRHPGNRLAWKTNLLRKADFRTELTSEGEA